MVPSQDMIWILDNDPACKNLYQQTLGLQYTLRCLGSLTELTEALANMNDSEPRLLIADPENVEGSLVEFFRKVRTTSVQSVRLPDMLIVSKLDNLELMRFFLKTGVRDYLMKPIRPNELVAKVERALHQMNNREILILRNDLDGIQVNDLTFREHQLLTIFISKPNRCVTREELYGAIWSKVTVNKKTLDVHLFNLRRKIRPHGYDIVYQNQTFLLCKTAQAVN
jgi:DNA-binding response OmpR family regulator